MVNQRWTIQCPKCGQTQQVEPQPGDYRCPYCGTKDFFSSDDGARLAQQVPLVEPPRPASATQSRWVLMLLGLLLGGVGAYFRAR